MGLGIMSDSDLGVGRGEEMSLEAGLEDGETGSCPGEGSVTKAVEL